MRSGLRKSKLRRFWQLEPADKVLLLRAVLWLAICRIWLGLVPFQCLADRLSAGKGVTQVDPALLRRVCTAVTTAAANVPWRSDCFPQAIAASRLLHRYGYASTIHLGIDKVDGDGLSAHAWLSCGDAVVTGGMQTDHFAEIHRLGE